MDIPVFLPHTPKETPFPRCLSLDLEVSPKDSRIQALAGVRSDTGQSLSLTAQSSATWPTVFHGWMHSPTARSSSSATTSSTLICPTCGLPTQTCDSCNCPWSIRYDLIPSPFHVIRTTISSSTTRTVNSSAVASMIHYLMPNLRLEVFNDQLDEFKKAPWGLLTAWHWLTTTGRDGDGFDMVFSSLRYLPRPTDEEALVALKGRH